MFTCLKKHQIFHHVVLFVQVRLCFMVTQCSLATAMPKNNEMFIFSGLVLSCLSNNEKLTRFKIAADTLMTFTGEFFTTERERQSL